MKKIQNKKRLRLHLFITLFLYAIIGYLVMLFLQYLYAIFPNPVTDYLQWRVNGIYIIYLLVGLNCIFYHYWKKPWNYLEEVIAATQKVYEQDNQPIELSEPLREVESQMNEIKMSMLFNQQIAKEAENKKNELVMYLAHDIRTPLTTVIGYLSLLDEVPDMPIEQKSKYIGIALEKAERLEMLINELFEITRYHTSSVHLEKQRVDLYALLAQVIDDFYPVLSQKGNTAKVSDENDIVVVGDPEKLARVFNNLLKNAAAYSYPNTEITVTAKKTDHDVVITFKNQGATIPEEQLNSIFDKFNRLDNARMSDTGGAGLGLSIAKEIICLHGGEIVAQSNDETVAFTVRLPYSA